LSVWAFGHSFSLTQWTRSRWYHRTVFGDCRATTTASAKTASGTTTTTATTTSKAKTE
jgi:hypothetical protein